MILNSQLQSSSSSELKCYICLYYICIHYICLYHMCLFYICLCYILSMLYMSMLYIVPSVSGNGTNVQSRIGKSFLYKDKLDYVCKQGYVYDNSITRQRLICDRYNGSEYATWNGTELHCSSKSPISNQILKLSACCLE